MFGLTFEKLFLVAIVAGVVIGPQRLPLYTRRLAETARAVRDLLDASRARAGADLGLSADELAALDPRRYDPRRMVRDALDRPVPTVHSPEVLAQAAGIRPGQQYVVTGSAAHPHRVRLDDLPADDPRRHAARRPAGDDPSDPV